MNERRKMVKPIRVEFYREYHSPEPDKEISMEAQPSITLDQIVDNVGEFMKEDYYDLAQIYFMNKLQGHVYFKRGVPTFKRGRIDLPKDIKEEDKSKKGPIYKVRSEENGVLFYEIPDPNASKYVGLAYISRTGTLSFRVPKSRIPASQMSKIRHAHRFAEKGELDKLYPPPVSKPPFDPAKAIYRPGESDKY